MHPFYMRCPERHKKKETVKYKGVIFTISKKAHIIMLKAVAREEDLKDVEFLIN